MQGQPIFDSGVPLEGPFHDLLSSNREPTPQEVLEIRDTIKVAESEVEALKAISSQGNPDDRRRYMALASFIYAHRTVLSPIRRIPVEILERIFALATDGPPASLTYRLNQVSRLWKTAARSSPELLGVLPPIRLPKKRKGNDFIELFNSSIAQTPVSVPLSLHILDVLSHGINSAAQILYAQSRRWGTVSIQVDMWSLREISESVSENTPNLRRLKLYIPSNGRRYHSEVGHFHAFVDAPLLRELELECLLPVKFYFPWRNLTSYKLRSYLPIGLADVLRDDSTIEHFEYRGTNPFSIYIAPFPAAVLENLKTLEVVIYTGSPNALLSPITAPRLERLRVRDHTQTFVADLQEFLNRSLCGTTLTSLSFHTAPMDPGELTKILMLTPALIELECNDIPFADICMLSVEAEGSTLIPRLRNLVIHSPLTMIGELESLAQIRSRIADTQTRKVNVHSSSSSWQYAFSVRLVFQSANVSSDAAERLVAFHGRPYPFKTKVSVSETLWELDLTVAECRARNPHKRSLGFIDSIADRNLAKKLHSGILFLEEIPLEDLPEFQVWVLTVLHCFRTLEEHLIPQQQKFGLLQRANELFALCILLLRQQNSLRGFVRHGRYSLLYLTFPRDIDVIEEIFLHGRYKILDETETFWPYHDYSENEAQQDYVKWRREVGRT